MDSEIIVIGGGVVGCAVARVLTRYDCGVTVLERGEDAASGASKANSGIVHAGFDAVPGSLKARLNVEGAALYPALCKELQVPYGQPGALVLAFSEEDRRTVEALLRQGEANGVPGLEILEREDILRLEPNVNPAVVCALHAPTSGLVSPYELTYALIDHAVVNGADFRRNVTVTALRREGDQWLVETDQGAWRAKAVVNCAGVDAAWLHDLISPRKLHITCRRGQYHLLDHIEPLPFTMTMFQCPTKMGKGVLVSPTVHGNMLLGPTAEDIADGLDTATTAAGLAEAMAKCRLTWPNVNTRAEITNFSGVRAHEDCGDFVIGRTEGAQSAYEAVGIESPGLSAAPAIGEMLGGMIAEDLQLMKKADYLPPIPHEKPFSAMTEAERRAAIAEDPAWGSVVCRCEVVTEHEIRAAIRRPVGARSIDGVKRRTRAGMGRCQGGFCSPRVAELLSEELHLPLTQITRFGGESRLLTGTIAEALNGKEAE